MHKTFGHHRRSITLCVLALLTASAARAQDMNQHLGKTMPARETHPDEHLAMPQFPGGWVRFQAQSGPIEVFEYFPKGQNETNWQDKITLEVHHDTNTLPLDAYQRRALGQVRETCDGILEGRLQTGVNNGYPAAYWMLGCKHNKQGNFGEMRYTKAVQGGETLYLLSRSWRTPIYGDEGPPLAPQALQEVQSFLGTSVVCAANSPHPCPADDKDPTH